MELEQYQLKAIEDTHFFELEDVQKRVEQHRRRIETLTAELDSALSERETYGTQGGTDTASQVNAVATTSTFMELPAELRNELYRYCLVLPRAITFGPHYLPGDRAGDRTILNVPTSSDHSPFTPGLLRVSKQCNKEATGILYGENIIHLQDTRVAEMLFPQIRRDNVGCLRRVELTNAMYDPSVVWKLVTSLMLAGNLQSLTLEIRRNQALGRYSDQLIAEILTPLVRGLMKQRGGASIENALAVMQWSYNAHVSNGQMQILQVRSAQAQAFGARVARLVRDSLQNTSMP